MELSLLIGKFNIKGRLVSLNPFGNGNINDTFLAIYRNTFTETQVILQKVNRRVFPNPEAIMANMHEITRHCHEKLEADAKACRDDRVWQMPRIVKTKDGADFTTDDNGDVWRVITRIMSARAFDVAQGPEHAMECGSVLGHFHYLISDLPPETVHKAYEDRWEIEIVMRHCKSACEFDETRVQDDCSVIGSEFCDFLATVLTFRLIKAFDKAGLLEKMTYGKAWAS